MPSNTKRRDADIGAGAGRGGELAQQCEQQRARSGPDIGNAERAIAGSRRVVGLYLAPPRASGPRARPGGAPGTAGSAEQVGFARAVSDGATVAYLADVYVLSAYRGRGLGLELVREILEGDSGWEIRWLLHTADAQELYARFGFVAGQPPYPLLERPPAERREPPARSSLPGP